MKFCYIDECGTGHHNSIFVMAGVLLDFTKINKHRIIVNEAITSLFNIYHEVNKSSPNEIKTYQIYEGKKRWSRIDPNVRKAFIKKICLLCSEIPVKVFLSAINFSKYKTNKTKIKTIFNGYWQWAAAHIILQIQSFYFKEMRNKGNTLCIFDDHHGDMNILYEKFKEKNELHNFYSGEVPRKKKELKEDEKLNQIVDLLSVESSSCVLVQLADVCAYLLRRHMELKLGAKELFDGDAKFIEECYEILKPSIIFKDKYWKGAAAVTTFLDEVAPNDIKKIIK